MSEYRRSWFERQAERVNEILDAAEEARGHVQRDGGDAPDLVYDPMRRRFDVFESGDLGEPEGTIRLDTESCA